MLNLDKIIKQLKEKNINLSHQRLKVLEYLILNRTHPTADQIYSDLHPIIPTLSKTTIYNTLRILSGAGVVRIISIEENELRFDIDTKDHGHFKCEVCGLIYDFTVDLDILYSKDLIGFTVNEKNIYYKGICPKCQLI